MLGPADPSITDLARELGAPVTTVQREVRRLERAGILRLRKQGRNRLVSLNYENPAVPPLLELVTVAFGPRQVVEEEFASISAIDLLYLFGSWAARHAGIDGPPPGDVDVLIVGRPDRDAVFEAADRAERRLHRQVNTTIVSPERWGAGTEPFLVEVKRRPMIDLSVAERSG